MKFFITTLALAAMSLVSSVRAEDAAKPYALDTCLVSGEKLGSMGKASSTVYEGQEIKFCCSGCVKQFEKDPAAGLKKYEAAVASKASGGAGQ